MSTTVKLTHKRAHCYVPVKSHRIWNCHTPNHNLVEAMIFPSPTDGNQNNRRILLTLVNAIPTTVAHTLRHTKKTFGFVSPNV